MATILIIEDDLAIRTMLRQILALGGHRVLEAAQGAQGLTQAFLDHPDLILTDLYMPVLDGWETIRQFRDHPTLHAIPIIAITASGVVADRTAALAAGCVAAVEKPMAVTDLLGLVETWIGYQRPTPPAPPR